jgi:hypothetical protein
VQRLANIRLPTASLLPWLRPIVALSFLAAMSIWAQDANARATGQTSVDKTSAAISLPQSRPPAPAALGVVAALDQPMPHGQPIYRDGSLGELFNRPGLVGGFAAGFLGAGFLGLVFGHGMVGGLGGAASYLGLMLQLALLAILGRLIWTRWTGRNRPAFAGLSPRQLADPYLRSRNGSSDGGKPAIADAAPETNLRKPAALTPAAAGPPERAKA